MHPCGVFHLSHVAELSCFLWVPLSMHMHSAGSSTAAASLSGLLSHHVMAGPASVQVTEPASAEVTRRLEPSVLPRQPLSMIQMHNRRVSTK